MIRGTIFMASSAVNITVGTMSSARAMPPAGAEYVPVSSTTGRIGEHAGQDGRQTGEGLGAETGDAGNPAVRPELGQENGRHDPEGHAQQHGDAHHDHGPQNGVPEATARLKGRGRQLGEDRPGQPRTAPDNQHDQHRE